MVRKFMTTFLEQDATLGLVGSQPAKGYHRGNSTVQMSTMIKSVENDNTTDHDYYQH